MKLAHAVNGRIFRGCQVACIILCRWSADSCLNPMIILFDCGMPPAMHQKLFLCADNQTPKDKQNESSTSLRSITSIEPEGDSGSVSRKVEDLSTSQVTGSAAGSSRLHPADKYLGFGLIRWGHLISGKCITY